MPYLYCTEVHQSQICGRGLFAGEDIPRGTVYWVWHKENPMPILNHGRDIQQNIPLSKEDLELIKDEKKLPNVMRESFYYAQADLVIYLRDGSEFMNHSFEPNSQIVYAQSNDYKQLKRITLRDIKKGQEICEDYSNYLAMRSAWVIDFMTKYWPDRVRLEELIIKRKEQYNKPI